MRIITLVTVLVGLGATLCEGEEEIWLNELLITDVDQGTPTLQVELAGRPAITDCPVPPTSMTATVQFYSGAGADDKAGDPLTVVLSADPDWAGNYASADEDETVCSDAACATATGDGSTRHGLWLTYTANGDEVTTVYCWGDDSGQVGGRDCTEPIAEGSSVPTAGSFIDWALYGAENAWAFKDSKEEGGSTPFSTIGDLNKCPDGPDQCVDELVDQSINAFAYTPLSDNEDLVWLNELNVKDDGTSVDLEIVGAPEGDGDAPTTISVDVTFYSATAEVKAITVEMSRSEEDGWNGHYQGSEEGVTGVVGAFPETALGGLQLSWGDDEDHKAVYCWGEGADLDSSIGTDGGSGLKCENIVKTGATIWDANRALYNWEQDGEGTPSGGGKQAKDFYWTDSLREGSGGAFPTIGKANKCATNDCIPDDQVLAEYEWGGTPSTPTDSSVSGVWLNELKVSLSGTVYSLDIELVGEPPMEYPTVPSDIEVAVEFFSAEKAAGGGEVTLESDKSDWSGQYVKAWQCEEDCTDAGKPNTLLGVKLTYDWGSKVYCWGTGADKEVPIGPGDDECEIPIAGYTAPTDGLFVDHGLYGDTHGEWTWKVSTTTTTMFATLGFPNVCTEGDPKPTDCTGTELVQTIAPYNYDVPANANADEVWLNEVYITVASSDVTAELEIVGGVASATNVEVTFYLGNTQVAETTEMKTDLIKSDDEKWNSHYVGKVNVPAAVGEAFPSGDELAGLQLKWGEKTSVYCWGSTAKIDDKLGDGKECTTVVKTGGPIRGGEGEYNRALFNWEETPDNGGSKVADFYWTDSKKGDSVFGTIGEVNTCPSAGDGECIPTDQKLAVNGNAPVPEKESSSSTTTASSSVSLFVGSWGLIYAVVGLGVITVMQCE